MNEEPDLTRLARTLGEPSRMRMLTLLMEGRALTAKELAYGAGVEPATASTHLHRLLADGLVIVAAQGRHKYFRLASADIARAIESLMVVALPVRTMPSKVSGDLRTARFCYDHLAGQLGTRLAETLLARGLLTMDGDAVSMTSAGEQWFRSFGIDMPALRAGRRRLAYACLDWSERKHHLAGALAAALAERMTALGWIVRTRHSRVVTVTERGEQALRENFGLSLDRETAAAAAPA